MTIRIILFVLVLFILPLATHAAWWALRDGGAEDWSRADWSRAGLLPAPPRTSAGYRLYPAGTVDRMRFIHGCARLAPGGERR